jgi:molecular chaperone HtpG
MSAAAETMKFEAEVQEVLNLVIHSLYSNKEIFLRELVSNASDACDKLRFAALADGSLMEGGAELAIEIEADKEARTLTIRDNGIGMSRAEVIENLGTIARSGTRKFLAALADGQKQDANLIGQFGVGFYSAFIIADRVTLRTRRAGLDPAEAVQWTSGGTGEYSVETIEKAERGTELVVHLKEGEDEYLNDWRIRGLISKYSEHLAFPVKLKRSETKDGEDALETINSGKALWRRPKSELKDEDYTAFYGSLAHDGDAPLAWGHNKVEGSQSYTTLLYLPSRLPMDLRFSNREERKGLKLYVRRVFIMDAAEQLLPNYLRFMRGVVDSEDLPLNVSREILQENKLTAGIRASCVKRSLDLIEKVSGEDEEKYRAFLKECGSILKEGLSEDHGNRERIAGLLRFASTTTADDEPRVSLKDYIGRMRGGQDAIYVLTGDSWTATKSSPHLEALARKGVEVLLLTDRVDEWVISYLTEFDGKSIKNIAKGDLDLSQIPDLEGSAPPPQNTTLDEALATRIKDALGERVRIVRGSQRLTSSASCLVVDDYAMALHMQRILKAAGQGFPGSKPTLELNPEHPLVKRLIALEDGEAFTDLAFVLHDQAVLAEGAPLEDPAAFVRRINTLIGS